MSGTLTEKLTKTKKGMRLYQQERAIQEVTEVMCELMNKQKVTRTELAKRLGCTQANMTHLLDGQGNISVRRMSDTFTALGRSIHFKHGPLKP